MSEGAASDWVNTVMMSSFVGQTLVWGESVFTFQTEVNKLLLDAVVNMSVTGTHLVCLRIKSLVLLRRL